jgi:uncharacterized protein with ATP-grasp and redox domains
MKPKKIMTSENNSFAQFTVIKRFPHIIDSMLLNNNFDTLTTRKLMDVLVCIPHVRLKLLKPVSLVSLKINTEICRHSYTWDNAPFLFVENYFYHLLKEITHFDQNKIDYFSYKKNQDVISKKKMLTAAIKAIDQLVEKPFEESLKSVLYLNLLGNMADLSHVNGFNGPRSDRTNLLIDHSEKTGDIFRNAKRIDIVLDNSGEELFFDLLLVYWIFHKTNTKVVFLHFKSIPYFVSDALTSDFEFLIDTLLSDKNSCRFANAIIEYTKSGGLIAAHDNFWCTGDNFCNMPARLKMDINKSDLIIFKGDLNYRKLVEDRHWDYTANTRELIKYVKTNCLIIRILKSEIMTGLDKINVPSYEDKEWMYNSKYGVIEYCEFHRQNL